MKLPLAVTSLCLLAACIGSRSDSSTDGRVAAATLKDAPVAYSFVVMGCNRIEHGDVTAANPSTANLEQLNRTFKEVAELTPKPAFFFFTGDMVLGLDSDSTVLTKELQAWVDLANHSPLTAAGIRLVAMPGNHEMLKRQLFNPDEVSNPDAEKVWLQVMKPFIYGNNGPKAGGSDHLATDQSQLTYSFNFQDTHFVIMNTDTYNQPGSVPVEWISQDVIAAHHNPAIKHIFTFGHKPAYAPAADSDEEGLNEHETARDKLWAVLGQNNCEAMLSAHNHLYYRAQIAPFKTWQVIAGNGGSTLSPAVTQKKDRFYGYTVVNVLTDGRVTATSMGRDVPAEGYMASAAKYPTTVRDSFDMTFHP